MDRQLSLEFARITEQAALKSARLVGLGDKEGADQAAVDGMHEQFALTPVSGTVVIGEGEIDEAPMLYIGEHVGQGGEEVDIAVDPVEGTNLVAKGKMVLLLFLLSLLKGVCFMLRTCICRKSAWVLVRRGGLISVPRLLKILKMWQMRWDVKFPI